MIIVLSYIIYFFGPHQLLSSKACMLLFMLPFMRLRDADKGVSKSTCLVHGKWKDLTKQVHTHYNPCLEDLIRTMLICESVIY